MCAIIASGLIPFVCLRLKIVIRKQSLKVDRANKAFKGEARNSSFACGELRNVFFLEGVVANLE